MNNVKIYQKTTDFPNFLKVLFCVEMWERFSYYGMRALLVLFLTSQLGFDDTRAYAVYSISAALGYAGPVIGGILADRCFGFRNMVLLGGIIMVIGHAIMALVGLWPRAIFFGLAFIAVGTGLFKGNISNLLGDCYAKDDPNRSRGFTIFYISINLGAFLAAIACAYVADRLGWDYGFGLAGIGMAWGLFIFVKYGRVIDKAGLSPRPELMKQRFYGLRLIEWAVAASSIISAFLALILDHSAISADLLGYFGIIMFCYILYAILQLEHTQRRDMLVLGALIIFMMLFFALEMQMGSLMNLFAERNVNNALFGLEIPAAASQAINPFSIIVFGLVISQLVRVAPRYDMLRYFLALLAMAVAFFLLYFGCTQADGNSKVGYAYLAGAMSLIGLGEVFIVPVVNAQLTKVTPRHLLGLIMGFQMLAMTFANLAGIVIAKFMAVPSLGGEVDPRESLAIYSEGFWKIAEFNLGVALLFAPLGFVIHRCYFKQLVN